MNDSLTNSPQVYVVSSYNEGTGGFNWFWDADDAATAFDQECKVWEGPGPPTTVRLVSYDVEEVPERGDTEACSILTEQIDSHLDLIEITLPALREAVV
jgi:hypothetical protein